MQARKPRCRYGIIPTDYTYKYYVAAVEFYYCTRSLRQAMLTCQQCLEIVLDCHLEDVG